MTGGIRAAAILPVRVGSQRLPGKALLADSGRALFLHTWEQARAAASFSSVWVATDSDEVEAAARAAGADVIRTSATPRTGSERCAEAVRVAGLDADLVVDVQSDWPEIAPEDLDALVAVLAAGDAPCATLATPLRDPALAAEPNVVKVVCDLAGNALYFSRAPLPFVHGQNRDDVPRLRHIGVYGFTRQTLLGIPDLPSGGLAERENLEQLRFLENGIRIRVSVTSSDPWGIESPDDYRAFLERIARREASSS